MLKVGLIGIGGIGAVHAKAYNSLKNKVTLTAIADFNEEKAKEIAKESGATVYRDAKEMLEREQLDLVDICLPTALHAEYVLAALDHVKNVLVEKPVCLTLEEAEKLLAKEKETGASVHVAHVVRFTTQYAYLKEIMDSGVYGKLITADFHRFSPKPTWVFDYDNPKRTGGMPIDLHIHDADYIRYLMGGDPDDVRTVASPTEGDVIRHLWSTYFYGDTVITAEASWDFPVSMPFNRGFRAVFEKATVVLAAGFGVTVYPEEGEAFNPELPERVKMDLGINIKDFGTFLFEIETFVDAILENRESPVPLSEAVEALRLVQRELSCARGEAK